MSDLPLDASVPHATGLPDAGWLARRLARLLMSRIHTGTLTIVTPSGFRLSNAAPDRVGGPHGVLVLHRWRTLRRLLFQGDISFAEAYMDGDWTSPDLPALIELAGRNMPTLTDAIDGTWLQRLTNRLAHRRNANTPEGSKRNIVHHYDLGNDFYRLWLDAGMSYSSALYPDPAMTLEAAQIAKQDRVLALLDLQGGEAVLEIGCGWGGLAQRLIRDGGCHVTGLTLSPAQLAAARECLAADPARADLRLQDYRNAGGAFDRVVSIEMLEAVGEAYWPSYFKAVHDRLKPGGKAVIQAITIAESLFEGYKRATDFIQHYIFPGGMLPTVTELQRQTARAGMTMTSSETFGASYARTLEEWRRRFHDAWSDIERQGFDRRFRHMWDYYLAYCEGGFRAGNIDVGLYVMERPA